MKPAVATAPDAPRIHPTALVEDGVVIGPRTAVWDGVHLRGPSWIGADCIVGEKTYVAYGVRIGDGVKINAHVYVCTDVVLEDRVMVAAGVVFTNDRYPRAFDPDGGGVASSAPNADTAGAAVRVGATLGARATIGAGREIGAYAMVGMGAVVTRDVPAYGLVFGNPARLRGHVCLCGTPVVQFGATPPRPGDVACPRCGRGYRIRDDVGGTFEPRD